MISSMRRYELVKGNEKITDNGDILFTCPPEGLDLCIYKKGSTLSTGSVLEQLRYIVMEAKVLEESSLCFQVNVYRNAPGLNTDKKTFKEADLRMIFGLLPQIDLIVPIDLNLLDSQSIFPPRTPGRLKMTVFGKPILKSEVEEIHLTTIPYEKEHKVLLRSLYLSETAPEIKLADTKLMDELGQWIPKQWDNKLGGREQCNKVLRELSEKAKAFEYTYSYSDWDQYGGWIGKTFEKTGWFYTKHDGKRWWLVDPEGNAFISTGLDCLNAGEGTRIDVVRQWCSFFPDKEGEYKTAYSGGRHLRDGMEFFNYGVSNLISAFGTDAWYSEWARILKMYLYEWGFNTIGNWSDIRFIRYAKMPYVLPLDAYSKNHYPDTEIKIFRDFPDVYAPELEAASIEYATALEEFKDDPYLIGYFMRNEPAWAFVYELNIAEEMLANLAATASKAEFITRMKGKYQNIASFNEAWQLSLNSFDEINNPLYHACSFSEKAKADLTEFSIDMITRYVELPAKACRKVDPNHLNLGMRYAYITDTTLLSGHENFDVFSINSYQQSPYKEVGGIGQLLDMPVMIGEFHHGALDMGLTAHGIKGVTNQIERGKAYQYYVEQGVKSPYFLGAHYFQLNDQSCLGRFDGENYQIGLVDVAMQEYKKMVEVVKKCHSRIYKVADGNAGAYDTIPKYVPPVHY